MSQPNYEPLDRRPIQSRNTRWAEKMTDVLVKRGFSPNGISLFGMAAAIIAGVLFGCTSHSGGGVERALWLCGALLCQVRLLCNLFDGMVAVSSGIASPQGELYNEVPDRVSDAAIFIGLGYSLGGNVTLGFAAALVAVFVAYVRATAKSVGAPNDFCGPMAKPQRMALVTVVSCYLAFAPVGWRLSFGGPKVVLLIVILGGVVTAFRRLKRAAAFLKGANQ